MEAEELSAPKRRKRRNRVLSGGEELKCSKIKKKKTSRLSADACGSDGEKGNLLIRKTDVDGMGDSSVNEVPRRKKVKKKKKVADQSSAGQFCCAEVGSLSTLKTGGVEDSSDREVFGFTIIEDAAKEQEKSQMNLGLPDWLLTPSLISSDLSAPLFPVLENRFLDDKIKQILHEIKVTHLFPVQDCIISEVLGRFDLSSLLGCGGVVPRDICCSSPTGSGKTLAFVLPMVQALSKREAVVLRVLAVLPLHDLAAQVYKTFGTFAKVFNLRVVLLTSKLSKTFAADIVVATPSLLVRHLTSAHQPLDVSHLRFLIFDEADKLMESSQNNWIDILELALDKFGRKHCKTKNVETLSKLKVPLQRLLFSATLYSNPVQQSFNLFMPKLFTTGTACQPNGENGSLTMGSNFVLPSRLDHSYVSCSVSNKPLLLLYLLSIGKLRHVLCFTNAVETTHRLAKLVQLSKCDVIAEQFSSNLVKWRRDELLTKFSEGKIDILICTDMLARGIDITGIEYVVSYDMPDYFRGYIHRAGRTARAGQSGTAISFILHQQFHAFRNWFKATNLTLKQMKIDKNKLMSLEDKYKNSLSDLEKDIKMGT